MDTTNSRVIPDKIEAARLLRQKNNSALLQRHGFNPSTKMLSRPQAAEDGKPAA